jgi:hypothetical protein
MSKPEHQQPALGRNPNRVESWPTPKYNPPRPSSSQIDPRQTGTRAAGTRQTGVWHSSSEQDALKTGVWNPSRQAEAPVGNRWVLLGIVLVCSLSSFVVFQSLLRPTFNPQISARQNAPRALPPAVNTQSSKPPSNQAQSSEAEQVAASAVTFGEQSTTGATKPVESTGATKPVESTGASTIVETTPTATLPANQIRLEQVDFIGSNGGQPVLHFKDGSSLNVDAFTLGQLPSDVRLRITYSRGRDGP